MTRADAGRAGDAGPAGNGTDGPARRAAGPGSAPPIPRPDNAVFDGAVDPVLAAARGRCPRCGAGSLFAGTFEPAARCEACGLDLGFADPGDGAVVPVILVVGFVVVGLALWVETSTALPLWGHFVLWPPLAVLLALPLMRAIKGALIGQQYRTGAAEGRIGERGTP